jgi:hypothetical protein
MKNDNSPAIGAATALPVPLPQNGDTVRPCFNGKGAVKARLGPPHRVLRVWSDNTPLLFLRACKPNRAGLTEQRYSASWVHVTEGSP